MVASRFAHNVSVMLPNAGVFGLGRAHGDVHRDFLYEFRVGFGLSAMALERDGHIEKNRHNKDSSGPIAFKILAQIIIMLLHVVDDFAVDLAGRQISYRTRIAISADRGII
jgi:hypothetical protein